MLPDCRPYRSVVVRYLNIFRVIASPSKANTELVVDADAVLSLPVALQRLKTIGSRNPQVFKLRRVIEHVQLSPTDKMKLRG